MTRSPCLVFLGCGNMGASIVAGVAPLMPEARIVAIDPDLERARGLVGPEGARVEFHADYRAMGDIVPDLAVVGVKPQTFGDLEPGLRANLGRTTVVSIMAGIALATLAERLGTGAVVRVMPNLPVMVRAGMSVGCARPDAIGAEQRALVERVFTAVGRFDWVADETLFELANPVFSCGPGFVFAIAEQMIDAAVASGVPADLADRLVRQTFLGSATMLARDARPAGDLKRAVTSPNGTTQAGLGELEAPDALPRVIPAALKAAHRRALELAAQGQADGRQHS